MAKPQKAGAGLTVRFVRGFRNMVAKHPQLFVVIITTVFSLMTKYGNSFKAQQEVQPTRLPERFFPSQSSVLDFPYGNIHPVSELVTKEEVVFLMYYAPWCTVSSKVKLEFMKAAKYFQNKVRFAAVNCWWPKGECRKNYKFLGFPEIYLYHVGLDGYKYTGVPTAEHMVQFIEDILYPLKLLHSAEEIKDFIANQDNSLIGYFDFNASPQPPGYLQFYYASMRFFEKDVLQPVRAAVVTQYRLAQYLGLPHTASLVLRRSTNTSLLYPLFLNFTSNQIQSWVYLHKQIPVVKLLSPPGVKSLTLSREINKGPTVIVFAPRNNLHGDYYYDMVREVMLDYINCNNSQHFSSLITKSVLRRNSLLQNFEILQEECRNDISRENINIYTSTDIKNCCVSVVTSQFGESQPDSLGTVCDYCKHVKSIPPAFESKTRHCTFVPSLSKEDFLFTGIPQSVPKCLDTVQFYNAYEYRTLCCKDCSHNMLSNDKCSSRKHTDSFVVNSMQSLKSANCKKLDMQYTSDLYIPSLSDVMSWRDDDLDSLTGAMCATNSSVRLYVIDIKHHSSFLQHSFPGVHVNLNEPSVILVDKQAEANYIMNQHFSKAGLAKFIQNYTNNELNPFHRSEEMAVNCHGEHVGVCIKDVTTATFHQVVMDSTVDVLLLFYTPWCGFCSSFSHVYLSLARYFHTAKSLIFARINADKNDLPYEFTVNRYPMLLFFPAHKKADSVVFPENVPKTLPNLIKFILHHSTHDLRLDTAVDVCSKSCIDRNKVMAVTTLQNLKNKRKWYQRRLQKQVSCLRANEQRAKPGLTNYCKESAAKFLKSEIHVFNKKIQDLTLLHNFLSNHREKYLSRDKMIHYFSEHLQRRGNE